MTTIAPIFTTIDNDPYTTFEYGDGGPVLTHWTNPDGTFTVTVNAHEDMDGCLLGTTYTYESLHALIAEWAKAIHAPTTQQAVIRAAAWIAARR